VRGLPAALAMLPEKRRTRYRKHLKQSPRQAGGTQQQSGSTGPLPLMSWRKAVRKFDRLNTGATWGSRCCQKIALPEAACTCWIGWMGARSSPASTRCFLVNVAGAERAEPGPGVRGALPRQQTGPRAR
jgi:hypothetical protein